MYTVEIRFECVVPSLSDAAVEAFDNLLAVFRMNGQICGSEFATAQSARNLRAFVTIPDSDALQTRYFNQYVQHWLTQLHAAGTEGPHVTFLDELEESLLVGQQSPPSSYILYTTFLSLLPPLRSGSTFEPIPLYRIPPTRNGEYHDIICWHSDYQACGRLFLNDCTAQRAVMRELMDLESTLSRQGRAVCKRITKVTDIPVYYYLYRSNGRSRAQEMKRRCPGCGAAWYLDVPWHGCFDFRCDACLILSTIGNDI